MTQRPDDAPIASTLSDNHFKNRADWIAYLSARALKSARRHDVRLELAYDPEPNSGVRLMIEQEQACCAFLRFEMFESAAAAKVNICIPESARETADLIFEKFETGAKERLEH